MVVLVEDDDRFREILVDMLEAAGLEVAAFGEPVAALRAIGSAAHVDLLITDLCLPGMRGEALAGLARQVLGRLDLPVIAISALYARRCDAPEALWGVATAYIPKPFDMRTLINAVASAAPATAPRLAIA